MVGPVSKLFLSLSLALIIPAAGASAPEKPRPTLPEQSSHRSTAHRKLKVLVFSPTLGWSHMQYQGRLADLLTNAGHEVHILMQDTNPLMANHTGVTRGQRVRHLPRAPGKETQFLNVSFMTDQFSGPKNMLLDGSLQQFQEVQKDQCIEMITDQALLAELEAEHYDVRISESFHICPFGLFHRVGVRTVVASLAVGVGMNQHAFGVPTFPSWSTNFLSPSLQGPNKSFLERLGHFYLECLDYFYFRHAQYSVFDELYLHEFGPEFPTSAEIMRNVSLLFVNANEFFVLPHFTSHKVVYIGGVVEGKSELLSQPLDAILNKSSKGVVLFSFGSLADPTGMSERMKRAFLRAFSSFPDYDFVWKYNEVGENESAMFAQHPNVHVFDWVTQKAMLRHPRLKAFITHCGLNSLNEAAAVGVPMVGVPLFADQLLNAALMNVKRIGVYLDITQAEEEQPIVDAISEVLFNDV